MSHPVALYGLIWLYTTFPRGVKPPGRTVYRDVDRPGPRWTRSRMENSAFIGVNLSNVRVIMAIMHVPVIESLCQATTGRILVLKYMLSSACGHL
jgi:hypothetical protein